MENVTDVTSIICLNCAASKQAQMCFSVSVKTKMIWKTYLRSGECLAVEYEWIIYDSVSNVHHTKKKKKEHVVTGVSKHLI